MDAISQKVRLTVENNPLHTLPLFHIGPIPIAEAVVTTWGLMALMVLVSWAALRRPHVEAGWLQMSIEIVIEAIEKQVSDVVGKRSEPFMPLLATLFLFLAFANLSAVLPGIKAPTGQIETPAALALIVFLSTHYFGISIRGWSQYLRHYAQPSLLLTPLNVLAEFTRTFSLMIRLFGNMMSHEFVLSVVSVLAGLLVPVPFLLLGTLIGLIQAYIFTVLASVYIGAAAGSESMD
jgi:F-type H+-transporting ATPase subunit a